MNGTRYPKQSPVVVKPWAPSIYRGQVGTIINVFQRRLGWKQKNRRFYDVRFSNGEVRRFASQYIEEVPCGQA